MRVMLVRAEDSSITDPLFSSGLSPDVAWVVRNGSLRDMT